MTILKRKIGIEMEGYLDTHPKECEIYGVKIGTDSSLSNSDWYYKDEPYGVELRTPPFTDLDDLRLTWEDMEYYGWSTDTEAGTHIHVDIRDFSTYEKAKLLRFGKAIEKVMFLFVDEFRNQNDFCKPIHIGWATILDENDLYWIGDEKVWNKLAKSDVEDYIERMHFKAIDYSYPYNEKHSWLNVLSSAYSTAEFRLYHSVRNANELIKQAKISEAIINTVKSSSISQLDQYSLQIALQDSIDDTISKFLECINLDIDIKPINKEAIRGLKVYKGVA